MEFPDPDVFEQTLRAFEASCDAPGDGLFGPGSTAWKAFGDALFFLGSGRAALLQLAHPFIAEALHEHSQTESNPVARFYDTFRAVHGMVFGDLHTALKEARTVYRVHTRITGTMSEEVGRFRKGEPYAALDVDALLWVWATMFDTSRLVLEEFQGGVAPDVMAEVYADYRRFGLLFAVPESRLPPTVADFDAYMADALASSMIAVGTPAARIGRFLMRPPSWRARRAITGLRALTARWMPPRLREPFGLRYGLRERAVCAAAITAGRGFLAVAPERAHMVPAAVEAQNRVAGRPAPDVTGRRIESAIIRRITASA